MMGPVAGRGVRDVLAAGAERLRASDSPYADARLLLTHVLEHDAAWLLAHAERMVTRAQSERFRALIAAREQGVPVAYLMGAGGFYGRRFAVTPDVLVPRPETEHIVERAIERLRTQTVATVADIGTGSGAIACTLAAECPDVQVYASDVSAAAIEVAKRNAKRHGVSDRCTFLSGDLGQPFAPRRFDGIVANLPYVPTGEIPSLPAAAAHEPRCALDGGADGLTPYRRLVNALPALIKRGSWAFLEAGPGTLDPLRSLVSAAFPNASIQTGSDYAGRERFLCVDFADAAAFQRVG